MENVHRLIRLREVKEMVPFSSANIYKLMKEKKFPKLLKVGGSSLWRLEDVLNYMKSLGEQEEQNSNEVVIDCAKNLKNKGK